MTLPGALGEVLRERASAAAKTHAREADAAEDAPTTDAGEWTDDVLQRARQTVAVVMAGRGGRGAQARLAAAKLILDRDFLGNISDAALEAELRRRLEARK